MTRTSRHPFGFTLVELMAALAVIGVVTVALGSAMVIASKALPDEKRPITRVIRAGDALTQLADELAEAVAITERGAQAVSFTVADRNGDGAPERIRYAWGNTAGAPLTRAYNGGTAVTLAENVHAFSLAYTLRQATETYPGPPAESTEQLFSSFDNSSNSANYSIKKKEWIAQLVSPKLPANATAWRITRAKVRARYKGSTDGQISVEVRTVDASDLPTTTILDFRKIDESSLPSSYAWLEVPFTKNKLRQAPSAKAALAVVAGNNKDDSAEIEYNDKTGNGIIVTNESGSPWKTESGKGLRHYVYGTFDSPGTDLTAVRRYVTAVAVGLQVGEDVKTRVNTSVRTLNEPELLRAFWELETGQATNVDRNGDGQADFGTTTALVMNPALRLDGGTSWTIPVTGTTVTTQPDHGFNDLITVVVRFRDADSGDNQPAMVCVNADWVGTDNAQIYASLTLTGSSTQTLLVTDEDASGDAVTLVSVSGLPSALVDLRLLIDPDLNTVNVKVNGVDRGTFYYSTRYRSTLTKYVQFAPWSGAAAEFARVSVRVGDRTP